MLSRTVVQLGGRLGLGVALPAQVAQAGHYHVVFR